MLREQQIDDNRKLLESVRRNYNYNLGNGTQCHDNKKYNWLPVHDQAIKNHHRKAYDQVEEKKQSLAVTPRKNVVDANNNHVVETKTSFRSRREMTEPPIKHQNTVDYFASFLSKKYFFLFPWHEPFF